MNFDVEWWNWLFKMLGVVLAALTFAAGAGVLITERVINARQTQQVASMTADIAAANERTEKLAVQAAEQRERAAKAEAELLALQRAMSPRLLDHTTFVERLKGSPKTSSVEILYKENDEEAHGLAIQIRRWLGAGTNGDGAGWTIVRLRPLREGDAVLQNSDLPTVTKAGLLTGRGVGVVAHALPPRPANPFKLVADDAPVHWLLFAFQESGVAANSITEDPTLNSRMIRVVVGPK